MLRNRESEMQYVLKWFSELVAAEPTKVNFFLWYQDMIQKYGKNGYTDRKRMIIN